VLTLRDATTSELPAVIDLTLEAYGEYATELPSAFWQMYRSNIEATLREAGAAQQIIAVQEGTVNGSVLLYPPQARPPRPGRHSTGWPEVRLLAVAPSARGQGVARTLMRECLRRARGWDAPCLQLHTMEVMQVARAMYERMGFVRLPELDFQPGEGIQVMGYGVDLRIDSCISPGRHGASPRDDATGTDPPKS
jgi:ribosomal protein S18 acetylase RimI-like enzyme